MRKEYYEFIQIKGIADVFLFIIDIPYSTKLRILKELSSRYPVEILNNALYKYKKSYIDSGRVEIFKLTNLLIYFCENIKKN
jgi:hypothetical protein